MKQLVAFLLLLGLSAMAPALADDGKPQSADAVDVKSTPAPKGSIVLFDGKSLDGWESRKGGAGTLETARRRRRRSRRAADIITKEKFDGHFKLHVEFRVPYMPKANGPGPRQQRRLRAGPLRGAGPGQLRPEEQEQRLRRHLRGGRAAGQRLQGADGLAELRHRLPRPEVRERQED